MKYLNMEMNKKIAFYRHSIWILIVLLPILIGYFFYHWSIVLLLLYVLAGLLILLSIGLFKNHSFFQNTNGIIKPLDFQNENLIVEGKAKHINGDKRIKGILYLTKTKIIFEAYDLKISVLSLEKIESVQLCKYYGILKRGIAIKRIEGQTDYYILNYAKDWKRIIDCSIKESLSKKSFS